MEFEKSEINLGNFLLVKNVLVPKFSSLFILNKWYSSLKVK
jgi:hypothetical protein